MTAEPDKDFIERIDQGLRDGRTWEQMAEDEAMPLSTLYLRIHRLGYRVGKRLVPIHAAPLEDRDLVA